MCAGCTAPIFPPAWSLMGWPTIGGVESSPRELSQLPQTTSPSTTGGPPATRRAPRCVAAPGSAERAARSLGCTSITSVAIEICPSFSPRGPLRGKSATPPLLKSASSTLALATLHFLMPALRTLSRRMGSMSLLSKKRQVELSSAQACDAGWRWTKRLILGCTRSSGTNSEVSHLRCWLLNPYLTRSIKRLLWKFFNISAWRTCTASTGSGAVPFRSSDKALGRLLSFAQRS
mmetsp:Transcript_19252/g.51131  ORF Transcript_19252/g.51131 Transcript_19252/m.51131 type:complete len:233 (+) Transcript_19252:98-796(+)